jgi:hypothetical protein
MSGVAKTVTKQVGKVGESLGIIKEKQSSAPAFIAEAAKTAIGKSEAAMQRDELMARRRARRGGRALLSEARLSPESGVGGQTLGSSQSV